MRSARHAFAALLFIAGPLSAQTVDLKILKLSDTGELQITQTITTNVPYTYTVMVPVTFLVMEDGKEKAVTKYVSEQRVGQKQTLTTGYGPLTGPGPLANRKAVFSDLRGNAIAPADLKTRLQKGPAAVILLSTAPLNEFLLNAFKDDTLILRYESLPTPTGDPKRIAPPAESEAK